MAQPVRQCSVALKATRFSEPFIPWMIPLQGMS
jgi:hypothetical protein